MPTDDARSQHAADARPTKSARFARTGAVALSMLLCSSTLAQSLGPAEAAPLEVPAAATPVEASSIPTPAEVARTALDTDLSTIHELRQLQRRENEAWTVRSETSLAWPAVGLGVGSLLTPILVPLGSVFLATADDDYESTSDGTTTEITNDNRDSSRRAGAVLLALGLTAVATVIYCSILVHRRRHAKRSANQELLTVREQRTRLLGTLALQAGASGSTAN